MLHSAAFPAPYSSVPVLTRAHTCRSLAIVVHCHSSFVSRLGFRQVLGNRGAVRGGGFVAAARKNKRHGSAGFVGMEDDIDDDEDDFDDEYDEGEEDDEGMLPLEKMDKWFKKRPKGFGEGKVYDTSVEDKLLDEMRQSRIAQAENLKKLKSNPGKHASNTKAEVFPIGVRVRLVNLPKKKNIHRDLKSALQGIPGIVNIVPAVTGNKKTRDPICKGFAFIDFRHEEDAVRFVELYSGQTITFGKIQKQIKCELLNAESSSSSLNLSESLGAPPELMGSAFVDDSNEDSNIDDSALSSWVGTNSDDLDGLENEVYYGEEQEDDGDNQGSVTDLRVDSDDSAEMRIDHEINLPTSEQVDRNPPAEQKSSAKVKQENARKKKSTSKEKAKKVLDVPGSAKRLKIREKAVLSDVFSKYGLKTSLASKDK
ncbi:uncharacterized protein LOC113869547 isoform X2 [Abrus precatorius]|uniref:Uncharacterized protein LOC113869547 isoform X2 n=1 Tax=Abrus precatorius TaxID=3816 RepID=A0A8B8M1E7_ABRPR|nr:uncharacterized protein LOC113869547 isoform X2 [Abrus precatorius]